MREVDRREVAAFGHSPKEALRAGLRASLFAVTAKVDGRAEAMFGLVVTSALSGEGTPWFLGTDEVYRHGRDLLLIGRGIIGEMRRTCPNLSNHVSADNARAIRLLGAWGFEVEPEQHDVGGEPMRRFRLIQGDGAGV